MGAVSTRRLDAFGDFCRFSSRAFFWLVASGFRPRTLKLILGQLYAVGASSVPVVMVTGAFVGAVLALQTVDQFESMGMISSLGIVVNLSVLRELGPILAAVLLAGRVGGGLTAEMGTMRVTEQIDALTTLSTNPYKYLVVPRVVAAVITLPLLVLVADIIGVMGGFVVGTGSFDFNPGVYIKNTVDFLDADDVTSGLIKAAVFGFIIAIMGCFHGFNSKGGAQGVGRATTNAVVTASILILATNYIMTSLLFAS